MNGTSDNAIKWFEDFDAENWPGDLGKYRHWISSLASEPTSELIRNVTTKYRVLQMGDIALPVSINDRQYESSYVTSSYNGMVDYPLEELSKVKSLPSRIAIRALIHAVAPALKIARVNRAVSVNNWLVSTNLMPAWSGSGLQQLSKWIANQFPRHVILIRSLNRVTNASLYEQAHRAKYMLLPSRQVYLLRTDKPNDYLKHANLQADLRLLEHDARHTVVEHKDLTEADEQRIVDLYGMLYLEKYSMHNPQLTRKLINIWRTSREIRMFGLRSESGTLDGIVGCFQRGSVVTAPLLGYDTRLPQRLGLYRQLTAIVFRHAAENGWLLHRSSGAPQFKRLRGAKPEMEYSAVYCEHLPPHVRAVWYTLQTLLTQVGARVLKKFEL